MSVRLWAYESQKCDGDFCPNDCDRCSKAEDAIEDDGFITRDSDLYTASPLERVTDTTARPTTECCYPMCEACRHYGIHGDVRYCTVPMVVNKQIWHITAEKIRRLEKCMLELQTLVTDEILRERDTP